MRPFDTRCEAATYAPSESLTHPAATAPTDAVLAPSDTIPWLADAVHAAAPQAAVGVWVSVLEPHLISSGITTPRRVAALLGQAAAGTGPAFAELAENTLYMHAERLCAVFPSRFPTLVIAQHYVGNSEDIACRAYAGKLGNGDETSRDGWRFRGSGLLQLTGRSSYEAFARSIDAPVEQVAEWIRTPGGAAASACWYWRIHALNALADAWSLAAITLAVNGPAMLDHAHRVAAAEAALRAVGDS